MMNATPVEEHQWLRRLIGEWAYEHEAVMEPGQAPQKFVGTETVRALGEIWIVCEGRGAMPGGGEGRIVMTLGYDPAKRRFVGTFIGSMMTHMWVYEGELDEARQALTLHTHGPSMCGTEGKLAQYKDIIELKSNDHRTLRSALRGEDGEWREIMAAHYRRRK